MTPINSTSEHRASLWAHCRRYIIRLSQDRGSSRRHRPTMLNQCALKHNLPDNWDGAANRQRSHDLTIVRNPWRCRLITWFKYNRPAFSDREQRDPCGLAQGALPISRTFPAPTFHSTYSSAQRFKGSIIVRSTTAGCDMNPSAASASQDVSPTRGAPPQQRVPFFRR